MTTRSPSERWAHFRFAIVGPLLAAPPEPGELKAAIEALAAKSWHHPISGEPVHFAFATIERWFYQARAARQDPVATLRRRRRADAGVSRSLSSAIKDVVREQYRAHPGWSVQLHYDNLAVTVARAPTLGPLPSYTTVRRFMRHSGLDKRPRPRATPGAQAAAVRKAEREVRSFEAEYAMALWRMPTSRLCGVMSWSEQTTPCHNTHLSRRRRLLTAHKLGPPFPLIGGPDAQPLHFRHWR